MNENQRLIEQFVRTYEANFGEWPARTKPDQQHLWESLILAIGNDLDAVVKRILEQRGPMRRKPYLPEWENALKVLNLQRQEREPSKAVMCEWCYGRGQIVCVARREDFSDGMHQWKFNDATRRCSTFAFPCRCKNGDLFAKNNRISDETRQKAWESFVEILNLCGFKCAVGAIEHRISLQEYLDSQVGKEPTPSPAGMIHAMILESYRNEASVKGVPYTGPSISDPRNTLPEYLDHLRAHLISSRAESNSKKTSGLQPMPDLIVPGGMV